MWLWSYEVIWGHENLDMKWHLWRHLIGDLFTSSSWPQLLAVLLYNKNEETHIVQVGLELESSLEWFGIHSISGIRLLYSKRCALMSNSLDVPQYRHFWGFYDFSMKFLFFRGCNILCSNSKISKLSVIRKYEFLKKY